jgi:hypothetical protein
MVYVPLVERKKKMKEAKLNESQSMGKKKREKDQKASNMMNTGSLIVSSPAYKTAPNAGYSNNMISGVDESQDNIDPSLDSLIAMVNKVMVAYSVDPKADNISPPIKDTDSYVNPSAT